MLPSGNTPACCTSKAGLLGLTRCVGLEGAPHGVTCVMISQTWVETEILRRNVAQVLEREGGSRTVDERIAEIALQDTEGRVIQPDEIAALAASSLPKARGVTTKNSQIAGGAH